MFGPVLKEGLIGLRQMAHTGECSYSYLMVWGGKAVTHPRFYRWMVSSGSHTAFPAWMRFRPS